MLYSHQHKFIFVKTIKTAGTSLEICLSRHMRDEQDIITTIAANDEKIRKSEGVFPRNYLGPDGEDPPAGEKHYFWNHMPVAEIYAKLPEELRAGCRVITAERHPYEKTVSMAYYYFAKQERKIDFPTCLELILARRKISGMDLYSINGKIVADTIIRYEHLLEDTNLLLASLNLPTVKELPQSKMSYRLDKRPAEEILSTEQKKTVQEQCAREFEFFGYQK